MKACDWSVVRMKAPDWSVAGTKSSDVIIMRDGARYNVLTC